MKTPLSIALLFILTITLTACNTVKGVGEDVSAGGRGITKAANKVERRIQN